MAIQDVVWLGRVLAIRTLFGNSRSVMAIQDVIRKFRTCFGNPGRVMAKTWNGNRRRVMAI